MSKFTKQIVALAMAGLFIAGFVFGYRWKATDMAKAQAAWEKERATHAKAETSASEAAREEEQQLGRALNVVATDYLKEKDDAKLKETRLLADLRADTVRLRNHWAACETGRLSQAAGSAAELDAAARLRNEGAAAIVRAAAECDAHVAGLQSALMADRQTDGRN
jgi:hypothetical protein